MTESRSLSEAATLRERVGLRDCNDSGGGAQAPPASVWKTRSALLRVAYQPRYLILDDALDQVWQVGVQPFLQKRPQHIAHHALDALRSVAQGNVAHAFLALWANLLNLRERRDRSGGRGVGYQVIAAAVSGGARWRRLERGRLRCWRGGRLGRLLLHDLRELQDFLALGGDRCRRL